MLHAPILKKNRVKQKENKDLEGLFNRRRVLRTKLEESSKSELAKIEAELANKCAKDNYKKIKDEIKNIEEGGMNAGKLWKLRKKLNLKGRQPPTAMVKKMHQADTTKYLGDTINKNSKVASNLAERHVKAVASFSVIRAILEDIPLGTYRVEIGLEL